MIDIATIREQQRAFKTEADEASEAERSYQSAIAPAWELYHTIDDMVAEIERLHSLEDELAALIDESHGVAGYHLNGDVAAWEELLPGGCYEVLEHFDIPMGGWKRK